MRLAGKGASIPIGSAHFMPFQGTEPPGAVNQVPFTSRCIHTKLKTRRNPTEPDTQYKRQYFYPPIYITYCLLQCPGIRLMACVLLSGFPCAQIPNLEAAKDTLPREKKSCSKCFRIFSLCFSHQVIAFAPGEDCAAKRQSRSCKELKFRLKRHGIFYLFKCLFCKEVAQSAAIKPPFSGQPFSTSQPKIFASLCTSPMGYCIRGRKKIAPCTSKEK